jgi:hypothetical protein
MPGRAAATDLLPETCPRMVRKARALCFLHPKRSPPPAVW